MDTFKVNLQEFAHKYKDEIKKNAQFRKQFQDMCANIGVDPLASSKGFWSEILGVSDFYYELAVQIIEICNSMQERTGGLVYLDQVLEKVLKVRSRFVDEVSLDDCRRAIKKLNIFGNAFTLIVMNNGRFMVQSLPDGMSNDHTAALKLAECNQGIVTHKLVADELKWDSIRIENLFSFMLKEGIVWLDTVSETGIIKQSYYFPSLFTPITIYL
jgi:ESCRT-II complex subunit VPS22